MMETNKNLLETRTIIENTLSWANGMEALPIAFVGEDVGPFGINSLPLLEFGVHVGGAATLVQLGAYRTVIEPGTVVVMNGHFGYVGTPVDGNRHSIWWVSFSVAEDSPVRELGSKPLLLTRPVKNASYLVERYRSVCRLHEHENRFQAVRVKCETLNLLADLCEAVTGQGRPSMPYSSAIEAAVRLIHRAYARRDLTRAELARKAHLSEAQFGRRFLQEVGDTPIRYLTRLRISRACRLLERSRLNIGEVGRAVGFGDAFHFSRMFREAMGLSPRAYRNQMRA